MMRKEKYEQDRVMISQQDFCFKDNYRLIAVNLSKQRALDADPRVI